MGLIEKDNKIYAIIIADGTVRVSANENDPEAIKREYETSDGKKGVKFEKVYKGIKGQIIDAKFFDGDFGKVLNVTLVEDGKEVILALGTATNFAEDLMKKLPSIKLAEDVSLSPYSFTDDKGKNRKGITVWQDGEKMPNFFFDPKAKKNINGYPEPEGDIKKYDKDDWKIYFTKARKFLIKFLEKELFPIINSNDDDINVDDIITGKAK